MSPQAHRCFGCTVEFLPVGLASRSLGSSKLTKIHLDVPFRTVSGSSRSPPGFPKPHGWVAFFFFPSSSSLSCRMAAALVAEPKWRAAQLPRAAAAGSEAQKVS